MKLSTACLGAFAVVTAVALMTEQCHGAAWEGIDDFSGTLDKWDTNYIHIDNSRDGFFLSGGHLQLVKTATTTEHSGSGAVIWPQSLPFNANWTLMVDAHMNPGTYYIPQIPDQDVRLDVRLYSSSPAPSVPLFRIGVVTSPYANTYGTFISIEGSDPTNIIGTDITLGMTYDAATKQVTSFYFPAGNSSSLVIIQTNNVGTWPEMRPVLYGASEYWAVGSGKVWLDNFKVSGTSTWVSIRKAVRPSFNSLVLGRNYQLQISSDLNTWTNQGVRFTATNFNMVFPQYWDVDDWGKLFFRLQTEP